MNDADVQRALEAFDPEALPPGAAVLSVAALSAADL